jgi:hypothetical protein
MKVLITILSICFFVSIVSCKKDKAEDSPAKHCWQLIDYNGNNLAEICDKTETELLACVANSSCGSFLGGNTLTACNYYQSDGEKFCYQIGTRTTPEPITESYANLLSKCYFGGATLVKTTCIPCQRWYTRDKMTYKPNNTITYTQTRVTNYCGDTLTKIYQGRQIIKKDDADSLIVLQFSNNGSNW